MKNYNLLLKWLEEAELSVSSVKDKGICYTNLKSKRFGGMEYSMFFSAQEEDVLVFNMTLMTPPVEADRVAVVTQFLEMQNGQPDAIFEWWMSDEGDINLLYARNFSDLAVMQGHLPMFYYILEYMVDEVDAHYLDLVNTIVQPPRNADDPYAFLSFMKETICHPDQHIHLDREGTTWSADRFRGRLSGFLWALLDERKTPDVNMTDVIDRNFLLVVSERFATADEWEKVEQLRATIKQYQPMNNHNYADGELGKWEGMAVYYHQLPILTLCEEQEIDVN